MESEHERECAQIIATCHRPSERLNAESVNFRPDADLFCSSRYLNSSTGRTCRPQTEGGRERLLQPPMGICSLTQVIFAGSAFDPTTIWTDDQDSQGDQYERLQCRWLLSKRWHFAPDRLFGHCSELARRRGFHCCGYHNPLFGHEH